MLTSSFNANESVGSQIALGVLSCSDNALSFCCTFHNAPLIIYPTIWTAVPEATKCVALVAFHEVTKCPGICFLPGIVQCRVQVEIESHLVVSLSPVAGHVQVRVKRCEVCEPAIEDVLMTGGAIWAGSMDDPAALMEGIVESLLAYVRYNCSVAAAEVREPQDITYTP